MDCVCNNSSYCRTHISFVYEDSHFGFYQRFSEQEELALKVLILGFSSLQEIDSVMEKLIESTQCFLLTVVCGGTDNVAYDWAQKAGAPVEFVQVDEPRKLLYKADYLVIKLGEGSETPTWMKNLMMAWKKEGKHGTVIR